MHFILWIDEKRYVGGETRGGTDPYQGLERDSIHSNRSRREREASTQHLETKEDQGGLEKEVKNSIRNV